MDYDRLIQDSIEYIESRLTEELDVAQVVKQTYFSRFYYQRLFSSLVGAPLMEYVKKRRLSLAGRELAETNAPVIDIALKFGYGSHEGFTRAFKAYHGITPAQCRKYRLFHSFDKKYVLREAVSMQDNNLINVPDLISEGSAKRLAQNTDELAGILDGYCRRIEDLAKDAVEKEKESGMRGDVFTQIAREIHHLAGRMESFAREIRGFMYGVIEKSRRVCFAELAGQVMFAIKCLDDMAFQMNIITLNFKLNIERTIEPYKAQIAPVGDACLSLTASWVGEKGKVVELAQDFLTLVLRDMQAEAEERKKQVNQMLRETSEVVTSVADFVCDEAEKAGVSGCGFRVIADEIRSAADDQSLSLGRIESLANGCMSDWLTEAGTVRRRVDDHGFRLNILAFAAALELSRAPDEKGLSAASEQIHALAGKLIKAASDMQNTLDEINQLNELAESSVSPPPEPSYEKELDDMAFQGNIMYFYMKMEYEKIKHVDMPEEQLRALSGYVKRAGDTITTLHALSAEVAGGPKAALSVGGVADEITSLSADIQATAARMGVYGDVFAYLALEYGAFAGRARHAAKVK